MRQSLNEIKNVLDKHEYTIDNIICHIMKKFNFKTICWQSGANNIKEDGYKLTEIVTVMVLFPLMLLKTVNAFYKSQYEGITQMQKDVIYRLKNNEKMPWRRLLYGVCKKFQQLVNSKGEIDSKSAFILDDTPDIRTGRRIENISFVHDHVGGKGKKGSKLGFKKLVLGYHDGKNILPLDFSIHSEKKLKGKNRKEQYKKKCVKNSNGDKRRKECTQQKNTNGLTMIKRAVKNGFMAKYVLVDSWFSSIDFIDTIRNIKCGAIHVVCALKRDKRNYEYKGEEVNFKELVATLKKEKKESRCRRWNTRYFEVVVKYQKLGMVKLYISRFPYQKNWRIFLSTDTNLNFIDMMEIYSARWAIEVLFKEMKQHLGLCNCQSRDFDAQIASVTISCILYTFLAYYRRINDYETLGTLFEFIKDDMCKKTVAQKIWELFDELLTVVIKAISESGVVDILSFKNSPEYEYLKGVFEESFLVNQILEVSIAS
jgi:hypothetical protein